MEEEVDEEGEEEQEGRITRVGKSGGEGEVYKPDKRAATGQCVTKSGGEHKESH